MSGSDYMAPHVFGHFSRRFTAVIGLAHVPDVRFGVVLPGSSFFYDGDLITSALSA